MTDRPPARSADDPAAATAGKPEMEILHPDPAAAAAPARKNPAKKIALVVILLLGLLMAWYVATDRLAP